MRAVTSTLLLCVVVPTASARAQEQSQLREGEKVRIHQLSSGPNWWGRQKPAVTGTVMSLTRDSLTLMTSSDPSLVLPLDSLGRVMVSRGRKSNWAKGLGIGAGTGTLVGLAAGLVAGSAKGSCTMGMGYTDCAPLYGVGGAVLGLVAGSLFGLVAGIATTSERWEEIRPEHLRVQPVVTPDGRFGLGASVRF